MSYPMIDPVLAEVRAERDRQDRRFGEQNHSLMVWLSVLGEEFGEVCRAALDSRVGSVTGKATIDDVRAELVQTAAVAVATIECLDRNRAAWAAVPATPATPPKQPAPTSIHTTLTPINRPVLTPDLPQTRLGDCNWCTQSVLSWQHSVTWDGNLYHAGCLSKLQASIAAHAKPEPDRGATVADALEAVRPAGGLNMADRWYERPAGEAAP